MVKLVGHSIGSVVRGWVGLFIHVLFPHTRHFCPHYLSSARCINGYRKHTDGGKPYDGLTSHPGK